MIWKNSEKCTRSSLNGMQIFLRLFCLFDVFSNMCAYIIAGERGVYKDVSENS